MVRDLLVLEEIRLNYLNLEDTSDEWSLRIFILHSSSQKAFDSSKTINIQFNQDFLYFVTTLVLAQFIASPKIELLGPRLGHFPVCPGFCPILVMRWRIII